MALDPSGLLSLLLVVTLANMIGSLCRNCQVHDGRNIASTMVPSPRACESPCRIVSRLVPCLNAERWNSRRYYCNSNSGVGSGTGEVCPPTRVCLAAALGSAQGPSAVIGTTCTPSGRR